ncbi:DUF305 domain-containing protein [Thalassorhabdomicrobium marinisediminis]|uniref:DUF305 domain-containing protein n=1 Tax=Thalassorhabdomicrobium marinisediminis TaxID=2170577 RepID=UPI002491C820|nr:DUF305 domain-containing protein [Thalassorhabdomicrobium marinisediminis]
MPDETHTNAHDRTGHDKTGHNGGGGHGSSYGRFFAMVGTSTALMFVLMYLNTYAIEHVFWSETRFYMTFVMGATMAVVMLLFMWSMYKNKTVNAVIIAASVVVFGGALWLVRSQATIADEAWMSAMIPHHSIAIMTSKRAETSDPRVHKLAQEIIDAQNREISEMRFLLNDIEARGEAGADWPLGEAEGPTPIEALSDALATPVIAGIRPAPLSRDEITRGLDGAEACTFVRAVNARPILATDADGTGLAKISGALVRFETDGDLRDGGVLSADGGRLTLEPGDADGEGATLLFELTGETPLAVGFDGYWTCNG